jgi:cytokinin dehydrogenase
MGKVWSASRRATAMAGERWTATAMDALARGIGLSVARDEATKCAASRDFGGLARGCSAGVVRPTNVEQVRCIVQFAYDQSLPITVRGKGMSQSGQSIARDGLTVNMCGLAEVYEPDLSHPSIRCGSGVTWRQLVAKLLPLGLAPFVVPLNLDLTVGGTLSAGGIGSTSHRFGPAAAHVIAIQIVTGRGQCIWCGPTHERSIFDAVLGGVGRCGIITQIELALRPAASRVRTHYLAYDDLHVMLQDQCLLADIDWAHHLEGFCAATIQGLRKGPSGSRGPFATWTYGMHVSVEHGEEAPPSADLISCLHPTRQVHVEDDTAAEFAARYDVRFEAMCATGAWELAHPWLECILPASTAFEVIPRALEILPPFLGDGHRLTWLARKDCPASLAFPKSGPYVTFAVLPMGIAPTLLGPALNALRTVHDLLVSTGGKRYLSGWLFEPDEGDWRRHHNDNYASLLASRAALDPNQVFQSCLLIV